MSSAIIPRWISVCLGMSETPRTRQIPDFLKDVIPLIFSQAKLGDIARLGQTCKDWNRTISPYLKQLKEQAIALVNDCTSKGYIRYAGYLPMEESESVVYMPSESDFFCVLRLGKICVLGMDKIDPNATFCIIAQVGRHFVSDEATSLAKKCKWFFFSTRCEDTCQDYAYTVIQTFRTVYYYNQREKREHILAVCKAANLYLAYLKGKASK